MKSNVLEKILVISLLLIQGVEASDPVKTEKAEALAQGASSEFKEKFREQMIAICSNPSLKALQADKEKMMKMIIGNLFATPVAPECVQVKCDTSLFKEKLVDCNKVFACSSEAKELTCMTKNKDRLDFSLKKIDPRTYEDFAKFYLEKTSKYPTYLARKNPNLFKCDISELKISPTKSLKQEELPESEYKSFEEADALLANGIDQERYKKEIDQITDEKGFKKFLLNNFYSVEQKNERRFLGYMLLQSNSTFKNFKLADYISDGKIHLNKVQIVLTQKFADFHCKIRSSVAERLIAAQAGNFPPLTMKDQELIGEIMRFKASRQTEGMDNLSFDTHVGNVAQACLLESAALEAFVGTDRSVEIPSEHNRRGQLSSHAFSEMFGVDPTNINGQENEVRLYTESSGASGGSSYGTTEFYASDDGAKTQLSDLIDIEGPVQSGRNSAIANIANSMNDFQFQMGAKTPGPNFNHIFDSNYSPSLIGSEIAAAEKPDTVIANNDEGNSSKFSSPKAFSELSKEELTKLKEQTEKELLEKLAETGNQKSATGLVAASENPETALLKKRIQALEESLREKNSLEGSKSKTDYFAQARPNLEKRKVSHEKESRSFQAKNSSDSYNSRAPASDLSSHSSVTVSNNNSAANLKLITTKNAAGLNQNLTEGDKVVTAANISPEMLDYIYQKISDNNQETLILETSPGNFMEVKQDDKKLDKNGRPTLQLIPIQKKNIGNRKISSLPATPEKIKRDLKETKGLESVTRQMELNKVLKSTKSAKDAK